MAGTFAVTAQSPNEMSVLVRSRIVLDLVQVLLGRDRTLDEAEVDVVGVDLDVDQRAVDDVRTLGDLEQALVHVEEATCGSPSSRRARPWRSVGLVTSARPPGPTQVEVGQEWPSLLAALRDRRGPSRTARRSGRPGRTCRSSCRSSTRPTGVPMSVTTRSSMPEPMTPHVWAPSISPQTRTQRTHMMQRLWSIAKQRVAGVDRHLRVDDRQLEVVDAEVLGQVLQLAVVVGDADRADVVALEEQHLGDRPAVLDQLLGVGRDLHALGDRGRAGRA